MALALPAPRPLSEAPPAARTIAAAPPLPSSRGAVTLALLTALFIGAPWAIRPLEAWLPSPDVALVGQLLESLLGIVVGVWAFRLLRRQAALARHHVTELEHACDADMLTGLGNSRALARDLERALNRARRTQEAVSVLYLDIHALGDVNRRYGRAVGNQTLRMLAAVMRSSVRFGSDSGYRIANDEFALVIAADRECAQGVCQRLERNFNERTPHRSRLSAGVATWDGRASADGLIHEARHALDVHRHTSAWAAMA